MTAANSEAPFTKEELIELIARVLGWSEATTRLHLERIRDDFAGVFDDHQTLTQQRDRFRDIELACRDAAVAIGHAPQEVDWLPVKIQLGDRQFEFRGSPTEYSASSWALSQAAKQAADRLELMGLYSEGTISKEKAIARCVWQLMGGPYIAEKTSKPHRTAADYVKDRWAKLSQRFRKIYNRLQALRRKPTLPAPAVDQYVAPAPQKPPRFPRGQYRTVTALVYEYVTGEHREAESFETACREVRKELEP
jgi:hypothetical protein